MIASQLNYNHRLHLLSSKYKTSENAFSSSLHQAAKELLQKEQYRSEDKYMGGGIDGWIPPPH
jgi:hypothetical protein